MSDPIKRTTKMLGDAGEYYAVSQFTFAGRPATKMPDGWEGYDLAVESGAGLVKVSVKTRSESDGWKTSKWFIFDDRRDCDWIVFIFFSKEGRLHSWVIPYSVAKAHANVPGAGRKQAHMRDISWAKLVKSPLAAYQDNWKLEQFETCLGL
jgi:hypothetical protein